MPGIPIGPGTVFYLLAALIMPLVGVSRRLVGRTSPRSARPMFRHVTMALAMVTTGALSFWVFDRVATLLDGHSREPGMVLLSSPLLVALGVLAAMTAVSRLLRSLDRGLDRSRKRRLLTPSRGQGLF